jgi:hypothetical protein
MLAFTVWQPWASLIMIGAKPFEFRSRSYLERNFRGRFVYVNPPRPGDRIVVQAGARPIRWREVHELLAACRAGGRHTGLIVGKALPLLARVSAAHKCRGVLPEGAGLGTVVIGRPRNAGEIFRGQVADSDRGAFNWAWPMLDPQPWPQPVPARGFQGFWPWPAPLPAAACATIAGDGQEARLAVPAD